MTDPITISALLGLGKAAIDKIFPDPTAKAKAIFDLEALSQKSDMANLQAHVDILTSAASVIKSEAESEHWLTANWRPLTMITFVVIIANNFIVYPYLSLFFEKAPIMEIPVDMWDLLKLGIGGYIGGRSVEKTASLIGDAIKNKG